MSFPKQEIQLNARNFNQVGAYLQPFLDNGETLLAKIGPWENIRTLSQNRLMHMWFAELSLWLQQRGKAFADPEWVKAAMKHTYLGYENVDRVDVITGEISTVKELRKTSKLKTGELHHFLNQVEGWAREMGCILTIPNNCEFMALRRQQEQ